MWKSLLLCALFALSVVANVPAQCFSHAPLRPAAFAPRKPGFSTAFSQKGLDYVKTVGLQVLQQRASTFVIPNVTGSDNPSWAVGNVTYQVSNIKLHKLVFGNAAIQIKGKGFLVVVESSGGEGTLNWHWREERWPHVQGTGKADINVIFTLKMTVEFMETQDHLQVSQMSATLKINQLDLKIKSKNDWFYNFLITVLKGTITSAIENGLQKAIPTSIEKDINKALMDVPVRQQIIDPVVFDIGLVQQPLFADSVFRFYEAGDSYDRTNPNPCPESICPLRDLPTDLSSTRMVQMYMSDFVPNSLTYAFMQAGLLKYVVTPDMVPRSFPFKLNSGLLAGMIPALQKAYPNKNVTLGIKVLQAPQTQFLSAVGVSVRINATIEVQVQNGSNYIRAFNLNAAVIAEATASLAGWQVYGKVSKASITISVSDSIIGDIAVPPIQSGINFGVAFGLPTINKALQNGIGLPRVPGFSIAAADIVYAQNYLSLALDLAFNSTAFFQNN